MSAGPPRVDPRSPREHHSSEPVERHLDAQRAYVLLEEARLRCEGLRTGANGDEGQVSLGIVHQQLGLAGWTVSTQLEPTRRQALLAQARLWAASGAPFSRPAHTLAQTVVSAHAALTEDRTCSWEDESLRLAQGYLLNAMGVLDGYLRRSIQA
jgi:hypothetical protein